MGVREDEVLRPDGKPGLYGVVEPKKIATGVVAVTERNEVVLVGQWRYPLEIYSWEIVTGGTEPDEDPLAGAQRELVEEAGLEARRWERLGGEVHLSNCFTAERAWFFMARDLVSVGARPDPTERLEVAMHPFDEVVARAEAGEITDAMTLIGLHRAARVLERGNDRGVVAGARRASLTSAK